MTREGTSCALVAMRAASLKMLKNKLGEYVRLAAAGRYSSPNETQSWAEIVPPRPGRRPAEAIRSGWIIPPALEPDAAVPRKPIMPFRKLAPGIETDREER